VSHLLIINRNLKFCVVYGRKGKYIARIVAKFNCFTEITILDITDSGNEQESSTSSAMYEQYNTGGMT